MVSSLRTCKVVLYCDPNDSGAFLRSFLQKGEALQCTRRPNRGPTGLDRFTDLTPHKPVLPFRRLLRPHAPLKRISQDQAERGHGPIIVLDMARVR